MRPVFGCRRAAGPGEFWHATRGDGRTGGRRLGCGGRRGPAGVGPPEGFRGRMCARTARAPRIQPADSRAAGFGPAAPPDPPVRGTPGTSRGARRNGLESRDGLRGGRRRGGDSGGGENADDDCAGGAIERDRISSGRRSPGVGGASTCAAPHPPGFCGDPGALDRGAFRPVVSPRPFPQCCAHPGAGRELGYAEHRRGVENGFCGGRSCEAQGVWRHCGATGWRSRTHGGAQCG